MALTKRKVDAAKPKKKGGKPKRTVTWDERVPAFGVRAHAGGKKSYVIRYRNAQGRERLLTLGGATVLTVDQARKKAKRLQREAGLVEDKEVK